MLATRQVHHVLLQAYKELFLNMTLSALFRYYVLKAREDEIAAYEARMKPIWDAEKAAAKAKASREQLITLAKETGTKVGKITLY